MPPSPTPLRQKPAARQWNAQEAERLSGERTGFAETRRSLKDRDVTLAKREREAETQRSRNEARERELDASLAAMEAVGEGLVIYEDADGRGRLKPPMGAQTHSSFAELLARMKKAPNAAIAVGRRLAASIALQRDRAREQELAEGQAEWSRELSTVRAAAQSIAAVHTFARDLIRRLPVGERDKAEADLRSLVEHAARDVVMNDIRAAKSRDDHEQ